MRSNRVVVAEVMRSSGGVIRRQDHPELVGTLAWLRRCGDITAVLQGVYCPAARAGEETIRIHAALLWHEDIVLTGLTAARVSFWPGAPRGAISVAADRQLSSRAGFRVERRTIPETLVVRRGLLRYTTPALTALDLCPEVGGDGIDVALRSRATTLAAMHEALALTRYRDGNAARRCLLLDSRDEPWSAAERRMHRLLRAAGIGGWKANVPVGPSHRRYYLDIAFARERLVLEIDGRIHSTLALFESDRWRQNWLVLQGWRVLRFTWPMLVDQPDEVIRIVRAALAGEALETLAG